MAGEFDAAAAAAQAEYDALIDPDAHAADPIYAFSWTLDAQSELMALLVYDKRLLAETAHLLNPKYFTEKANQGIAKVLFDHFKKYKASPSKAALKQELFASVKEEDKLYYGGTLLALEGKYVPGLQSRDYYRDSVLDFAQHQALLVAMDKIFKEKAKGPKLDMDKIASYFKEAVGVNLRPDTGTDYFANLESRYADHQELKAGDLFTTGLPKLDESYSAGAMQRGEIHAIMAPSGVGKSLFLAGAALANVTAGKKVLVVSCEMGEDSISYRLDSMLSNIGQRSLHIRKEEVLEKLSEVRSGLEQDRPLIIKHFATGTCDVPMIRALVDQLEQGGWKPDLLLVDYVGEMRIARGIPKHEALRDIISELAGLASEKEVCLVTALQANRDAIAAMEGAVITSEHMADSYAQLQPLHGFWTLNQTASEKAQGLGRLYIDKSRSGISKETINVQYDEVSYRITEISKSTYRQKQSDYKEKLGVDAGFFPEDQPFSKPKGNVFGKRKTKAEAVPDVNDMFN